MQGKDVTVVIPAYNESMVIGDTVSVVDRYFDALGLSYQIVVVDDGSTDSTSECVRNLMGKTASLRMINSDRNRGKGHAVRQGVLASEGALVLISDADMSTPIAEFGKLLESLHRGYDIAVGSRALPGSEILVRQPWYRERMGRVFNRIVRFLIMGGIRDTQCGFKLFRADAAKKVFSRCTIDGFAFDVEVLYLAKKMGLRIAEVPVRWMDNRDSKVRLLRHPLSMIMELLRIRIAHR